MPGGTELIVILLIAVLLFGANKIPKLARSTGQAMGEFQKGREQVEAELEEMKEGATIDDDGNIVDEDGEILKTEAERETEASIDSSDSSSSSN
ncbi:twin-arginine translocase TatA/TatE family subunit [Halosimplex litoreum]|uniref:Twin-arginine translocase TatA/TatE family subunit n=2 Tax=Halosimplex litoreum TaxID=1198301 RepID=A0A7U3WTB2_9EURY|nr:twin-arginine translocase TatA/TatE family subunit [Halosimplex litoreum]QPV65176.1 twin-arginine translocase TatA/TatE family subunit [Halosimplex litoreum]